MLGRGVRGEGAQLITSGPGSAVDVAADQTKVWYIVVALSRLPARRSRARGVNGFAVGYMRIPPMLATLGTLGAGLGIALLLQNGVNVGDLRPRPRGDQPADPRLPNLILDRRLVVGCIRPDATWASSAGTRWRSSSEEAARRVGLKVERHLLKVYTVGGLASGLGGFLSLAYFSTTSVAGHSTDNLQAITAVALGGTSLFGGVATIIGTLIGVWIPAVLQNGFIIVGVQPYWQMVAVGVVLILAIYAGPAPPEVAGQPLTATLRSTGAGS